MVFAVLHGYLLAVDAVLPSLNTRFPWSKPLAWAYIAAIYDSILLVPGNFVGSYVEKRLWMTGFTIGQLDTLFVLITACVNACVWVGCVQIWRIVKARRRRNRASISTDAGPAQR